jgi:SNF2 family DNA or RNA helicase
VTTQTFKAAYELQTTRRFVLTGTPVQNDEKSIAALCKLLRINSPEDYDKPSWWDKATEEQATEWRTRFLLRRLKLHVLKDLPAKTEIRVDVNLSAEEQADYDLAQQQAESAFARYVKSKQRSGRGGRLQYSQLLQVCSLLF